MTNDEPSGKPTKSPAEQTEDDNSSRPAAPGSELEKSKGSEPVPSGKKTAPESQRPATAAYTRIGAAWAAVAVAMVVLILLLIFIVQNQDQVRVEYFGATTELPLGVLLLFAAAGGALLVIVLGIARMVQLRWQARRDRRTAKSNGPA